MKVLVACEFSGVVAAPSASAATMPGAAISCRQRMGASSTFRKASVPSRGMSGIS